jgi:hypothetical protein
VKHPVTIDITRQCKSWAEQVVKDGQKVLEYCRSLQDPFFLFAKFQILPLFYFFFFYVLQFCSSIFFKLPLGALNIFFSSENTLRGEQLFCIPRLIHSKRD